MVSKKTTRQKKVSKKSSVIEKKQDLSDNGTKIKTEKKEPSLKNDKLLLISILIIIGCILALILLPKIINNGSEDKIESVEYNGFVFEKYGSVWVTNVQIKDYVRGWDKLYEIYFHYTPQEVEYIPSLQNSNNDSTAPNLIMDANLIYITTDPNYPASVILGGVEISKILGNIYKKQVKSALTKPDNRTNAPVKTCDDIGPGIRIIHLKLGNETRIYSDNGCVVVEGVTPLDVVKASEKLTFELLKIM